MELARNEVPSTSRTSRKGSSSKQDETEEDISLLFNKFKKFLCHNKVEGGSRRFYRSSGGKARQFKSSVDPLERLCYNCGKLGHFKAYYP